MLKFKRIRPGVYMSECKKFGIVCRSYPPEWAIYENVGGTYEIRKVCPLLCIAKREAQKLQEVM